MPSDVLDKLKLRLKLYLEFQEPSSLEHLVDLFLGGRLPLYNAKFLSKENVVEWLGLLLQKDRRTWAQLLFMFWQENDIYREFYEMSPFKEKREALFVAEELSGTFFSLDTELECIEDKIPKFVTCTIESTLEL